MTDTRRRRIRARIAWTAALLALAGGAVVLVGPRSRAPDNDEGSSAPARAMPAPRAAAASTGTDVVHPDHTARRRVEPVAPVAAVPEPVRPEGRDNARIPPERLAAVLPLWMRGEADVESHFEELTLAGKAITRARGRYEWPNGSLMEVEITDLGQDPGDELVRAAGFNPALTNATTQSGFTLTHDSVGRLSNMEYDHEAAEGNLQLIVTDRFLVEIQLENLPLDSFTSILDTQLALDALVALDAGEDR